MLIDAAGAVSELCAPGADLLIGVDATSSRAQHEVALFPGATVLLYTDGLVERRGEGLSEGLDRLRKTLGQLAHLPLDELCDELLERLRPGAEDDIALLALRYTG